MKRKIHRGIFYYPMEVDHTTNKRIRLLFNDHDSDGYWVWSNLISQGYRQYGYYFPADTEDVELLSADCRKTPELITEIIHSCVKRGLFSKKIFDAYNILTSDRMQLNFLKATYDMRRKGTIAFMSEQLFLITHNDLHQLSEKFLVNIIFQESGKDLFGNVRESSYSTDLFKNSLELSEISTEIPESPGIAGLGTGKSEIRPVYTDTDTDTEISNTIVLPQNDQFSTNGIVGVVKRGTDDVADLAVGGKKKSGAAPKKKNPDSEPYWHLIIRKWVDFNNIHVKFDVKPIPKRDYSHIHRIIEALRERATGQGALWTEPEALKRWEAFLTTAYTKDKWLKNNFLPSNLESQMQTVFKIIDNPNGQYDNSKGGQSGSYSGPAIDPNITSSGKF